MRRIAMPGAPLGAMAGLIVVCLGLGAAGAVGKSSPKPQSDNHGPLTPAPSPARGEGRTEATSPAKGEGRTEATSPAKGEEKAEAPTPARETESFEEISPAKEEERTEPPSPARHEAAAESVSNSDQAESDEVTIDPLGPNAACYVCHVTFVQEEMAKVHLQEEITCVKCHGLSAAHANDENIGATKPDIIYKRDQIDASCRKCHETHDAPATQVIARWQEIGSPKTFSACTDCHGTHKIER